MRSVKFRQFVGGRMDYGPDIARQSQADVNIELNDGTFTQYTGWKDKGGVEIYEGDILDLYGDSKQIALVKYVESLGRYTVGGLNCDQGTLDSYGSVVVGNIYQIKEVLRNA